MSNRPKPFQSPSKWGYFSEDGKEYYVTDPRTPRPWHNLISNDAYGLMLSQAGGGYSIFHPQTKIGQYALTADSPGKWLYVRDDASGKFWSATWHPVQAKYDDYRCAFGMGYSVFDQLCEGIRTSMTVFVPMRRHDPVDIWQVKVTNESSRQRKLSFFPYQEWRLAVSIHPDNETQWSSKAWHDAKEKTLVAEYRDLVNPLVERRAFMASSLPVAGWEGQRKAFLGHYAYGNYDCPEGVVAGKLTNTAGKADHTCGVLHGRMTLKPGETKRFIVVVGWGVKAADRRALTKRYLDEKTVAAEIEAVKSYWAKRTGQISVKTPDPVFDRWTNYWLNYQAYQCSRWCRSASFRFGFRDVNQDIRGVLANEPEYTRRRFLDALQYQFESGKCVRQWSGDGNHDLRDYRDSPYWIVFTISAYIKETGDLSILKEEQKYLDSGKDTVYGHALRALRHLWADRGLHGLSHIGGGDINDSLDMLGRGGKGVSEWISVALYWGLCEMEQIASLIKDRKVAAQCRERAEEMKRNVNKHLWDGAWWIRAFDDTGRAIGSHTNKEGRIQLNGQSWAVLSGISTHERDIMTLESVDELDDSPFGPKTFAPPYTKIDPHIGKFTTLYLNGNVYVHSVCFCIAANLKAGRGDRAMEMLKQISPLSDKFTTKGPRPEPIAFPNSYMVNEPGRVGEGTFGWLTGSASWLYFMSNEMIPGAIPDYAGLRVDPCVPSKWRQWTLRRPFRGATYEFTFRNPNGVQKGVASITVDGEPLEGTIIPPHGDGRVHRVVVVMG